MDQGSNNQLTGSTSKIFILTAAQKFQSTSKATGSSTPD